MNLLYGHNETVADFVASLIPECSERGFGPSKSIGVLNNEGDLIGGVVYHRWFPELGIIEVSAASIDKKWLTFEVLHAIHKYPFEDIKARLIMQTNSPDNKPLHRILKAYGYTETIVPELYAESRPGHIFTLTRPAWENNKFEKRRLRHVST